MKSLLFKSKAILLFLSLSILACESEKKIVETDVVGRWEVYDCQRAGKPTQTLNGAYFEFEHGNKLYTNITGDGIMAGYNIYNNEIVQQSGEKIRYYIESFSSEKMTLSTRINNVDFVLELVKTSSL
jgi:hypothetical protein